MSTQLRTQISFHRPRPGFVSIECGTQSVWLKVGSISDEGPEVQVFFDTSAPLSLRAELQTLIDQIEVARTFLLDKIEQVA